ncbi:MAG: hypothetical protein WCK89_24860, partial [bacterium]
IESDMPQASEPNTASCGADGAEHGCEYKPQMYRDMTEAEQEAALMQLIQETADQIVKVKADEQLHVLERYYRIGRLLIQALRNTHCIRAGGHHGKSVVEQVSWKSGVCYRSLQSYKKLAFTFSEEDLPRLVRIDLPWYL